MSKTAPKHLKNTHRHGYHKEVDPQPVPSDTTSQSLPPTPPVVESYNVNDGKNRFLSKPALILIASMMLLLAGAYYFYTVKIKSSSEQLVTTPAPTPSGRYDANLQKGPFICPSLPDFCQKGEYRESSVSGQLAKGTPIFAAFDGTLEQLPAFKNVPNMTILTLTDNQKGLQATYYIRGKVQFKERDVKAAEEITTASGLPIPEFNNKSFVFMLYKISNGVSWQPAKVTPETFRF